MSEVQYAGIVLEDQILDHLATYEGAMTLFKERIGPEFVNETDKGIQDALEFQMNYIEQYREPAPISVLSDKTGYEDFRDPVMPVDFLIQELRDRHARNELRKIIKKIARLADVPDEAIRYGFTELGRVIEQTTGRKNDLDTYNAHEVLERYHHRSEIGFRGPTIGFTEIDRSLGGLSGLVFVAGRLKTYKTWMLIRSAVEALQEQRNVDFFTLEMTPREIQDRALCMLAGISWSKFKFGALMPADEKLLREASDWLREQEHLLRFLQPPPGQRTVPIMHQLALESGAEVVYIDQLDKINPPTRTEAGWRDIAMICAELKVASEDFPIYCACQFNRQAEGLSKMADPSKTGLSDAIPQMADMMMGLYSNDSMKRNGILHYGSIASREYENETFELKVELSVNSNFRVIGTVDMEEEDELG